MRLIAIVLKYLKRYPKLSIATIGSMLIASFFEGASFGMLIPLIQGFTNTETSMPIYFIFAFLFLILVLKNIFSYLSTTLTAKLRFGLIKDLSVRLMDNLIEYDIKYFDNAKTGDLISNISNETNRIGSLMLAALRFIALSGKVIAYLGLLFLISFKASVIIFVIVLLVLMPLEFIMKRLKKLGAKISQALSEYNYKITEIFGGIRVIKTCGTQDMEKIKFAQAANKIYDLQYRSNKYINLLIPTSEVMIFGTISTAFLILLTVMKIEIIGAFPYIATYFVVLVRTLSQVNLLNSLRSEAINNMAAVANFEAICSKESKKTIEEGDRAIKTFSSSIEFKDVSFSYDGVKEVLRNINLVMPKGRITALVGESGTGKSTIVNLILRLYDVKYGEILVDGINLKDLLLKVWRRKIGFVSQDIFLFNTSVKENIAYGQSDMAIEDIIDAAKKALAHEFIMSLPHKYETVLGERGVKLSGGQKQRLSIARAIIHNPEIIILDEATSSLDAETERLISKAIDSLSRERTVIAIAHRLSTVVRADNIIVLDKGKVVDTGRHANLIKKDGIYRKLYESQFLFGEKLNNNSSFIKQME